jgi:hypothetical protein
MNFYQIFKKKSVESMLIKIIKEYWSIRVLGYWNLFITPTLHYSITPIEVCISIK